jgi:hypothetical protein
MDYDLEAQGRNGGPFHLFTEKYSHVESWVILGGGLDVVAERKHFLCRDRTPKVHPSLRHVTNTAVLSILCGEVSRYL